MRLTGDPGRHALAELAALCAREDVVATRAFVDRLSKDPRSGARALGERLARKLAEEARETRRRTRMLELERRWWSAGLTRVAGVDEVGMGPLAGPVVAAAVVFDPERIVGEADDSKQLDACQRDDLASLIRARARCCAVASASVDEIDEQGIHAAGLLAMRRAVLALEPPPERVLVDARTIPDLPMPQEGHVKGDSRSCTIASASILAKVHRDALMRELAVVHPGYGFETHAGYATAEHLAALRRLGPSPVHRMSWRALADHAGLLSSTFDALKLALSQAQHADGDLAEWHACVQRALPELSPVEVRRLDELARRRSKRRAVAPALQDGLPLGP